jgi:hypothetical protein
MGRYSKKNRKGGDKLDDIQVRVDDIQRELNDLKGSRSSSMAEESMSMPEPMSEPMPEPMSEEPMPAEPIVEEKTVKVDKTWVENTSIKFKDGAGGRVSLSFKGIIDNMNKRKENEKKGDTAWSTIKQELRDANSVDEVKSIIDKYKISFGSNYVAGTRRRRKSRGKKRTQKRR